MWDWDLPGNQRNAAAPAPSPPHHQPQVLQAASFTNSFPADPCWSWCSRQAGCRLAETQPAAACPEPRPPPRFGESQPPVQSQTLASHQVSSLLAPTSQPWKKTVCERLGGGGCRTGGVDLVMIHTPPEGRKGLEDEWIANQREGPRR